MQSLENNRKQMKTYFINVIMVFLLDTTFT